MDHDDSLLLEQIVRQTRIDERGPIAEFLAKKNAEQAAAIGLPSTASATFSGRTPLPYRA